MISKGSKADIAIRKHGKQLLRGVALCIDPSIGSNSSMPGWAVYSAGILIESGTIEIDVVKELPPRLQALARKMYQLIQRWAPDVLVYENIPAQRHGGGNAESHASLLKALGVILSVAGPSGYIPLLPVVWKKHARPEYRKGDESDAIEIGYVALTIARHYEAEPKKNKKKEEKLEEKVAHLGTNL
jgi:hypothetical protein